jgi:Uma2 family endonuclease
MSVPFYAASGIPEEWLIDLNSDTIEVYSEPGRRRLREIRSLRTRRSGTLCHPAWSRYRRQRSPAARRKSACQRSIRL